MTHNRAVGALFFLEFTIAELNIKNGAFVCPNPAAFVDARHLMKSK